MKIDAVAFSFAGDKYLGRSYSEMDCQAFVERCMRDCGLRMDLAGSNAWYREVMKNGWVGSPEDCLKEFGIIPKGALLFILKHDGKEPEKYKPDGIGNASHIGICIHRHDGAINSSSSRGCVCYSKFQDKSINGGWNRVGLYNKFTYGNSVDWILEHGGTGPAPGGDEDREGKPMTGTVTAPSGSTVNLRKKPNGDLIERIPIGSQVTILEYGAGWCKVNAGGLVGYMMTDYIDIDGEIVPGEDEPVAPDPDQSEDLFPGPDADEAAQLLADVYRDLKDLCDRIEQAIGRG